MHGNSSEIKKIVDWAVNKADGSANMAEEFAEKALQLANSIPEDYGSLNVRKVLACQILDPTNELSIVNKCRLLDMPRQAWYDTIYRPDYAPLAVRLALLLKGSHALTITQRFLDNALYADKDKQYGDRVCQIKYLNDMGIIRDTPDATFAVSFEVTEQQRYDNQQAGLNRFGFKVKAHKTDQLVESNDEQGRSSCGESGGISPVDNEPDIQK